tara:strand:+ start:447 stop:665 length:219 start_codon:yes stop_codon:yes gene_type:complete
MTDNTKLMYNDVEYDVSDLDDREAYWHAQVKALRKRIANARFELDQLVAAERSFSSTLINSLSKETNNDDVA